MDRAENSGLETWIQRKYGKALQPWFRAIVTVVSGSAGNYQVQLQPIDQSAVWNAFHQVAPTYVGAPVVGDNVECLWRDGKTVYVMWKAPN